MNPIDTHPKTFTELQVRRMEEKRNKALTDETMKHLS